MILSNNTIIPCIFYDMIHTLWGVQFGCRTLYSKVDYGKSKNEYPDSFWIFSCDSSTPEHTRLLFKSISNNKESIFIWIHCITL